MTKQFFGIIAFCTLLSSYVFSQQKTAGVIYYDQVIDLKSMAAGQQQGAGGNGGEARVMTFGGLNGSAMPEKITNKFEIAFNPTGAKFQKSEAEDITAPGGGEGSGGGMRMMMRFGGSDREMYFSASDKVIESFELNSEEVLLESVLGSGSKEAELSTETKKISGFDCKKAIVNGRNGSQTTIWYTTDLALKASPMANLWVAGVVLGIETDRMKFYATSVEFTKIKDSEVSPPKKGRTITQEDYQKAMEEMRAKFRNGGGERQIRIQQ
ncbi:MAG: GLPGLI family protein [Sphingobacteriales bacterium]|jgi:GLPGLI family protein|nr:GLPGLI family protein [Sphingobacteriales bacterium]